MERGQIESLFPGSAQLRVVLMHMPLPWFPVCITTPIDISEKKLGIQENRIQENYSSSKPKKLSPAITILMLVFFISDTTKCSWWLGFTVLRCDYAKSLSYWCGQIILLEIKVGSNRNQQCNCWRSYVDYYIWTDFRNLCFFGEEFAGFHKMVASIGSSFVKEHYVYCIFLNINIQLTSKFNDTAYRLMFHEKSIRKELNIKYTGDKYKIK